MLEPVTITLAGDPQGKGRARAFRRGSFIGHYTPEKTRSYEGMIRQLEDEVREYDEIKSGEITLPNIERLDQIAPFVAKMRIAKGVSQTELAHRLGVSKQVISRYEETE